MCPMYEKSYIEALSTRELSELFLSITKLVFYFVSPLKKGEYVEEVLIKN